MTILSRANCFFSQRRQQTVDYLVRVSHNCLIKISGRDFYLCDRLKYNKIERLKRLYYYARRYFQWNEKRFEIWMRVNVENRLL